MTEHRHEESSEGKVTASIVVHNTPHVQLDKVLDSLSKYPFEKIYIIDNGNNDSLAYCAEIPGIEYSKVDNRGFGAAHNIAIRKAMAEGSKFHLVLNADVWWHGDVIAPMIQYLNSNPKVGLVAPKTYYPDGFLQYTCRMLPSPYDLFTKRFIPEKLKNKRMKRYLLALHDHDYPLNSPYLLGSFMLFRIDALKETGLFDERFFMYPEDIDITRRIHETWKTIYWPEVSIIHEHQAASRKNLRMFGIHFFNMIKYFNKWGWISDPGRKQINKELIKQIHLLEPGKHQKGRG
ncbi:MAG: glycosyltransferase family 2 protein [Muribaculaceae bacterium]|nr:glycosyltransferase family 2 protein [Muribaculaceae bacterium]